MTRNSAMLGYAATDLERIRPLLDAAITRLNDQRRGQPGSSFGGSGGPSEANSPVENALGLNQPSNGGITPDKAAGRIKEIDAAITRIVRDLRVVAVIVEAETNQTAPTDKQRREAERENTGDRPCEHCSPFIPPTAHAREFVLTKAPSDVAGNLDRPMWLGPFCYNFVRKTGKLPDRTMLATRAAGGRVMVKA